ncbi:MAG: carbohydrate kinase, partial [Atribacterota bacterium]
MVTCFGEALIDFFPSRLGVPLEEVEAFLPLPGGAPANVAVALSRLEVKSAFMGKVGDDAFGRLLAGVLRRNGVDLQGLRFDQRVRTTCVFIAQPDPQSQEFLFFRHFGADMMFGQEDIDFDLLEKTAVFHFGSLSLTDVPIRETLGEILRFCQKKKVFISFDANYRPSLWESEALARQTIWKVLPLVDLFKVNRRELALLTQKDSIEEGMIMLLKEVRNIVVTMGGEGAFLGNDSGLKN